jgi:MFS family permease
MPPVAASDRLIFSLCAAEVLAMAGFGTFAALLPTLQGEWSLSNAAAGWIEGAQQFGYLAAVPLLLGLSNRLDSRSTFLLSVLTGIVGSIGFSVFASGIWSACLFRALSGASLAGVLTTGLKILSNRMEGKAQTRAIAFYTASFSLGGSLSVLLAGQAGAFGWRWSFAAAALAGLVGLALGAATLPRGDDRRKDPSPWFLDLRPALANRPAMAYSLAYAGHMWELYGFRAWLVAFLVFSGAEGADATTLAAGILALALPASVLGNEMALRFGRRQTLYLLMGGSAALAGVIGFTAGLPFHATAALCGLYAMTVSADSASLTAGAIAAARPASRGATIAIHSLIGFLGASFGPLAFGWTLDLAGAERGLGWGFAFAVLGLGVATGPIALAIFARRQKPAGTAETLQKD